LPLAVIFLMGSLGAVAAAGEPAKIAGLNGSGNGASIENRSIQRTEHAQPAEPGDAIAPSKLTGFDPVRVMMALVAVIGLILLMRAAAKRIFPGSVASRGSRAIKILSRCPIAPRQHLLLIQVGKRLLVVGDSGTQLNPLCQIKDGDEVAALLNQLQEETASAAWRFDALFGRARKSFDEVEAEEAGDTEPTPPKPPAEPADAAAGQAGDAPFDSTHEIRDPSLSQTRKELDGLSDKVRDLARQLGGAQ
jgi:flagellar biogenesis protein FliO